MQEPLDLNRVVRSQAARSQLISGPVRVAGAAAVAILAVVERRGATTIILAASVLTLFLLATSVWALLRRRGTDLVRLSTVFLAVDAVGLLGLAATVVLSAGPGLSYPIIAAVETSAVALVFLASTSLSVPHTVAAGALATLLPLGLLLFAVRTSPDRYPLELFLIVPANLAIGALSTAATFVHRRVLAENLVTGDLLRAGHRLRMTMDIVSASISNLHQLGSRLAETSRAISESARHQAAGAEEISSTAGGLASTMEQIARSTERSAATIGRTAEFSANGNAIVQRVIREILGIHETVDRMVAALARINDIADQTNLLALNAAIEASRAGDETSGFSVVASEIRALAEKASATAGEVSTWVRQIEEVITSGGDSSREAGEIFDTIARELAAHAGFIHELAQSVQGQLAANREVSRAVGTISNVVLEITSAADRLAGITGSLRQELGRLEALVSEKTQEVAQLARTPGDERPREDAAEPADVARPVR